MEHQHSDNPRYAHHSQQRYTSLQPATRKIMHDVVSYTKFLSLLETFRTPLYIQDIPLLTQDTPVYSGLGLGNQGAPIHSGHLRTPS